MLIFQNTLDCRKQHRYSINMYQNQNQIKCHNQKTSIQNRKIKQEKENYNTGGNKISRKYDLKINMQTKS
jgi:hypothetical protein